MRVRACIHVSAYVFACFPCFVSVCVYDMMAVDAEITAHQTFDSSFYPELFLLV